MAEHTEEPWEFAGSRRKQTIWALGGGHAVAVLCCLDDAAVTKANARRIVACVNACAGISTEDLESGAVKDMLAACRAAAAWSHRMDDETHALLRAAIDRATGMEG